ncbi:hypothetical protein SAMN02745194_04264 [Roseomonas rosea]|uniref:Uncharacterized protein n=2 Tax=Muricoccus roseus TaxID=198092 RepID=A0A1M6Q0K0_9PROT|nr:hypothetical protein SAMN02745194_04264 [Roseomonas rosea]
MPEISRIRYMGDAKPARRALRGGKPSMQPAGNNFRLPHEGAPQSSRAQRRAALKINREARP